MSFQLHVIAYTLFGPVAIQRQWAYPIMHSRNISVDKKVELTSNFSGIYALKISWGWTGMGLELELEWTPYPPKFRSKGTTQIWTWSCIWMQRWPPTISSGWTEMRLEFELEQTPSPLNSGQKVQHKHGSRADSTSGVDPQSAEVRQRWNWSWSLSGPTTTTIS